MVGLAALVERHRNTCWWAIAEGMLFVTRWCRLGRIDWSYDLTDHRGNYEHGESNGFPRSGGLSKGDDVRLAT